MANDLPKLPDEIIETVRQLLIQDEDLRWALGDYLADVVVEIEPTYKRMGIRFPRATLFRQIANVVGCDTSTLRDRQSVCTFYPPGIRREFDALSWSQLRACKSAGSSWREYAEWALANLPAPVALIRARIKHNGHLPPKWEARWERILDLASEIERDDDAPQSIRGLCRGLVDAAGEVRA